MAITKQIHFISVGGALRAKNIAASGCCLQDCLADLFQAEASCHNCY